MGDEARLESDHLRDVLRLIGGILHGEQGERDAVGTRNYAHFSARDAGLRSLRALCVHDQFEHRSDIIIGNILEVIVPVLIRSRSSRI